jgi:branched-chain amino acid transport system substrate-binding protein
MKNTIKKIILVAFVVVVAAAATYFLFREFTKTKEVKIGFLLPLSGEMADYGISTRDGAEFAISEFNMSQKRIKIVPVFKNQEEDPKKTDVMAKELAADKEIMGIVGPIISSTTLIAGKIVDENGPVLIATSATNTKISGLSKYVFRLAPSDAWQGIELARFAVNKLGYKKIAVIYQRDEDYSRDLGEIFSEEVERLGGAIVAKETYLGDDTDFVKQLSVIKTGKPEAIFVPAYTRQGALIAQQRARLGMADVRFLGADGLGTEDFLALGGKAVEDAIGTVFFDAKTKDPLAQQFIAEFKKLYPTQPSWVDVGLGYDATKVLIKAISSVGKINRQTVRDAVAATRFHGVTGDIAFDKNGDAVSPNLIKLQAEGGRWKMIEE